MSDTCLPKPLVIKLLLKVTLFKVKCVVNIIYHVLGFKYMSRKYIFLFHHQQKLSLFLTRDNYYQLSDELV